MQNSPGLKQIWHSYIPYLRGYVHIQLLFVSFQHKYSINTDRTQWSDSHGLSSSWHIVPSRKR